MLPLTQNNPALVNLLATVSPAMAVFLFVFITLPVTVICIVALIQGRGFLLQHGKTTLQVEGRSQPLIEESRIKEGKQME